MADDAGALYLSCSVCEGKYWSGRAMANPDARIRIAGQVYPVRLSRLQDAEILDLAWLARGSKTASRSASRDPIIGGFCRSQSLKRT